MNLHDLALYQAMNGEGSEGVTNPTVSINLIGNTTRRYALQIPKYSVENGLFTKTTSYFITQHGSSRQYESLAIQYNEENNDPYAVYWFDLITEYGTSFVFTASDLVNCEFGPQEDNLPSALYFTDPTKNASATITVNDPSSH